MMRLEGGKGGYLLKFEGTHCGCINIWSEAFGKKSVWCARYLGANTGKYLFYVCGEGWGSLFGLKKGLKELGDRLCKYFVIYFRNSMYIYNTILLELGIQGPPKPFNAVSSQMEESGKVPS